MVVQRRGGCLLAVCVLGEGGLAFVSVRVFFIEWEDWERGAWGFIANDVHENRDGLWMVDGGEKTR